MAEGADVSVAQQATHESLPPSRVRAVDAGWELLRLVQAGVNSLEETTTRVVAAQVVGVVGLWTQLDTFEDGPPRVLAWAAWALLLGAVGSMAPFVAPRRLARFWSGMIADVSTVTEAGLTLEEEVALVRDFTEGFRVQRERLHRGLRVSIALGILGLATAAVAYVIEKASYAP
jgi:hypothetical protein